MDTATVGDRVQETVYLFLIPDYRKQGLARGSR